MFNSNNNDNNDDDDNSIFWRAVGCDGPAFPILYKEVKYCKYQQICAVCAESVANNNKYVCMVQKVS